VAPQRPNFRISTIVPPPDLVHIYGLIPQAPVGRFTRMSQPEVTAPAVGSDSGIASAALPAADSDNPALSPYLEQPGLGRRPHRQPPRQICFDDPYVASAAARTSGTGDGQSANASTVNPDDLYGFTGNPTGTDSPNGQAGADDPYGNSGSPEAQTRSSENNAVTKNPDVAKRLDDAKTITVRSKGDAKPGDPAANILVDENGNMTVNPDKQLAPDASAVIQFAKSIDGTASPDLAASRAALRSMHDYLMAKAPDQIPPDWELQVVKDVLDRTTDLKFDKLTDENKKDADPIVDKDGDIKLNPDNPNAGGYGQTIIVYELDNSEREMVIAQKAAVRDLMKYFELNNPGVAMPPAWVSIADQAVPPPRYVPKPVAGGGIGGGNLIGGGPVGGGGAAGGGPSGAISEGGNYSPEVSPVTGVDSNGQLGLTDSFVDKVVTAIADSEGNFTSINPNDNGYGYGVSVSIRRWNQKGGELPTLLKAWDARHQGFSQSA
jgi:hypothetical protein